MDIRVQDILFMKKAHPCGDKRWEVLRTGMDFRLRCLGCGHEVMLPRSKAEKNIRQVLRDGAPVLICPAFSATARSAIVVSSVSPERCEMTAVYPARFAMVTASMVSVSVPI